MFDSILGSLFGSKTETKKVPSSNVLDRIRRRKLIVQKFKNVDSNNNLKRARIAKELLGVSRTEGERKAARKFYKDETELNNLKNKIKASTSINEKLSLARQGKRLATKTQKEFWENLINRLQARKQERKDAITSEKKALIINTDTSKEQSKEKDKDMEEIEEEQEQEQEQDIEESKSESEPVEDSDNDIKEPEEDDGNEEETEEDESEDGEEDEDENEEEQEQDESFNDKE